MSLKPGISAVGPVPKRIVALFGSSELYCVIILPLMRRFGRDLVVAADGFLPAQCG